MLYYIKLDPESDTLEVNEVKNIHQLSKATKISWAEIDTFLNGTSEPVEWLGQCSIPFPYIKKSGDMYYFSYYKSIIEKRNYENMSRDVINELIYMNDFCDITATSNKNRSEPNG